MCIISVSPVCMSSLGSTSAHARDLVGGAIWCALFRAKRVHGYVQVGAGKDPAVAGPWRHSREAVGKTAEESAETSPQSRGTLCQSRWPPIKERGGGGL